MIFGSRAARSPRSICAAATAIATTWSSSGGRGRGRCTITRAERYDDDGLVRAGAVVSSAELADVVALREFCERRDCWREVIDAGHGEDPELYAAWVPHRVDADLDGSSIYNRDLALATAYLGGQPVPSPARALPGWEADACAAMAVHLEGRGWQVRGPATPAPAASQPGGNVVVGALEAWRYGWAVAIVVRVDPCGEVYARRADDHEVVGVRALRQLRSGTPSAPGTSFPSGLPSPADDSAWTSRSTARTPGARLPSSVW